MTTNQLILGSERALRPLIKQILASVSKGAGEVMVATAVFSRQVFSLISMFSDEGLAIVVKEPVELVVFEVAVVCVEDVDG